MNILSLVQNVDNSILLMIKNGMHGHIMDRIMIIATSLGNGGLIWIIIAVLLMLSKKYRKVGIITLGALLLCTILGEGILKHVVQRARPSDTIPAASLLISKPLSYSFPSGHTASSFAAAGVLAVYLKRYAPGFIILASLIAFSRLYLYVHYPTDVVAGIILGIFCSRVVIYITEKIGRKYTDSSTLDYVSENQ